MTPKKALYWLQLVECFYLCVRLYLRLSLCFLQISQMTFAIMLATTDIINEKTKSKINTSFYAEGVRHKQYYIIIRQLRQLYNTNVALAMKINGQISLL